MPPNADSATLRGWAIPAATDIGFAAFYTDQLAFTSLALAAAGIVALVLMNVRGVTRLAPYRLTGVYIWVCVLKSGVHATQAGVGVALAVPLAGRGPGEPSPLEQLEESLPLGSSLASCRYSGVALNGLGPSKLFEPVALGVLLGLLLGKRLGILAATFLAVASKIAPKPRDARSDQMVAIAGIGFTMSLFIGTLAFGDPLRAGEVRLAVLSASLLSASLALIVLALTPRAPPAP